MTKIFYTSGTGSSQTLNDADGHQKIKIFDNIDSIDTSTLEEGEIVATQADGNSTGQNIWDYIDVLIPIGTIMPYMGTESPSANFLVCNGQTVSEASYPTLAKLFTVTDGQFTIPDLRGRFLEGTPAGGTVGTSIAAGLPNINGSVTAWGGGTSDSGALYTTSYGNWASANASSGGAVKLNVYINAARSNSIYGNSSTVQPPAYTVNYIIRAK